MERESWKVFLACAIGAGLGSLVALEINPYFWWVGLIVGFLAGYLSYEWKAVVQAIPRAYRAARSWHWEASPLYWKCVGWQMLEMFGMYLDFLSLVMVLSWLKGDMVSAIFLAVRVPIILGVLIIFCMLLLGLVFIIETYRMTHGERMKSIRETRQIVKATNPFVLIFWHLPRGLYWLICHLPRAIAITVMGIDRDIVRIARGIMAFARFTRRFGYEFFIRIHSEKRLLCGVDAMLGAGIGYFAGSALIGALAGGIFGLINYEVVTKRLLRLQPQPRS